MEATNKSTPANDFAIAKAMNAELYSMFVVVWVADGAGVSELHNIDDLNRAYILLINELEKIYERNDELKAIKPVPPWKHFSVLKNHTEEIRDYLDDTEDWGLGHNAKVERLCILAGVDDPVYNPEQQELINNLDTYSKKYAALGKKKWEEKFEDEAKNRQIPSYKLTYQLDGSILINDVLKLKKAHAGSSTERLLEQALKSPNTLFKPDIGQTSRNLSTVLSSAGFTKELRELFFPTISNSKGIVFRPTISRQQADNENIDTTELDAKLLALGAETEPKST
ncbi:MAG TPA: hypothetical protein VJ836_04560 [Candidatus Saccharimonadales bacterium]|nr:hypothetical protein [Candidatus Saccharimonadales bacterium]